MTQSSPDIVELLKRADDYHWSVKDRGSCGPHHLISDLAAALRASQPATPTGGEATKSAPVFSPSRDPGERLPSGDAAGAGADTRSSAGIESAVREALDEAHRDTKKLARELQQGLPKRNAAERLEAISAAAHAALRSDAAQCERDPLKQPQYIIEGIILRRLHEKRVDGYTLEMAKEIAEALAHPSTDLGCGDPGCKDPNCTYGKGPNRDPLSSPDRGGK